MMDSGIKAVLANLARLDTRLSNLDTIRSAHLREAACLIADAIGTPEDVSPFWLGEEARLVYADMWGSAGRAADRLIICTHIAALLPLNLSLLPPLEEGSGRISYFAAPAAHLAFERFSRELGGATVAYPGDFVSSCEEVYYGRSEFCLLPLASRTDGTLHGLRAMLDRYELHPAMECTLENGGSETTFMLLRRGFAVRSGGGQCFAFNTALDDAGKTAEIITAAESFGLRTLALEPVPPSEDRLSLSWDFRFDADHADMRAFICYMSLEFPQYTPLGLYRALDSDWQ